MIGSHQGAYLAEALYCVLKDYDLTPKVTEIKIVIIYNTFIIDYYCIFPQVLAITTDNASDNRTMVEALERLLKGGGSTFSDQYHAPCMAHVLNLPVLRGLKELGNLIYKLWLFILKKYI